MGNWNAAPWCVFFYKIQGPLSARLTDYDPDGRYDMWFFLKFQEYDRRCGRLTLTNNRYVVLPKSDVRKIVRYKII